MSKKPVPSKKQAVHSTRSRSSKYAAEKRKKLKNKYVDSLTKCAKTGETKRMHFVSPSGWYRGRQIFEAKTGAAPVQEIKA